MDAIYVRSILLLYFFLSIVVPAHGRPPQATVQPRAQIHDHFQRAQADLQAKDAASAEKEFRAILALDPKDAAAHTGIGVIFMGRGDCRAATAQFSSALAAQPSFARARALLGICQKQLGDPSARTLLEKSFQKLQEKPLRLQVGTELADLYEQQGDTEAAGSLMPQLVQLDPDNPDILFTAERIYSELADDTLNKLAIIAPGSARMQQVIAEKLINAGDLKGAISHYKKALAIDPRLPGAHFELGEALLESSTSDPATLAAALTEFETAIQTESDSARIECQLARIALLRSDPEQAYAHYGRAFTMNPVGVEAQLGLARLLMNRDKSQEAEKYLRSAVKADPLNAEAHYRLSSVCRKLLKKEEAEKELRIFQEIKRTKEQVQELYRQMNKRPSAKDEQLPEGES